MENENNPTVAFRIPIGLIRYMDGDIAENNDHRNRTEYIVTALREYEERREMLIRGRKTTNGGGAQNSKTAPQEQEDRTD